MKHNADSTGRNRRLLGRLVTVTDSCRSGVVAVSLNTGTTGRDALGGQLLVGWIFSSDMSQSRPDDGPVTGEVCFLSAGVLEVAGTDLVRRTLEVDAARLCCTGRRWTSGETERHLLRASLRSTSVSLWMYDARHGDRCRLITD